MLAPIRSSALLAARRSALSAPSSVLKRSIVTKEDEWSPEFVRAADASPAHVVLKDVVPQIEARWAAMSKAEQYAVYRQLEEMQRKDWKELSLDEKKAAYYVSFGPYGPRKPITEPGQALRTFMGVSALVGVSAILFFGARHFASPPPKTMTKEYQEQMNQKAIADKSNPITGISSESYKGKGYVQSS